MLVIILLNYEVSEKKIAAVDIPVNFVTFVHNCCDLSRSKGIATSTPKVEVGQRNAV